MTDGELRNLIQELEWLPRKAASEAGAQQRRGLVARILDALDERGGSFEWQGVVYTEKGGKLIRGLPFC